MPVQICGNLIENTMESALRKLETFNAETTVQCSAGSSHRHLMSNEVDRSLTHAVGLVDSISYVASRSKKSSKLGLKMALHAGQYERSTSFDVYGHLTLAKLH